MNGQATDADVLAAMVDFLESRVPGAGGSTTLQDLRDQIAGTTAPVPPAADAPLFVEGSPPALRLGDDVELYGAPGEVHAIYRGDQLLMVTQSLVLSERDGDEPYTFDLAADLFNLAAETGIEVRPVDQAPAGLPEPPRIDTGYDPATAPPGEPDADTDEDDGQYLADRTANDAV